MDNFRLLARRGISLPTFQPQPVQQITVILAEQTPLGLGTWIHKEKLRLARIDAPEVRGEERADGLLARDFLRDKINGKDVVIQTTKDKKGKYGRYIADVWFKEGDQMSNASDQLVQNGFAEYREY